MQSDLQSVGNNGAIGTFTQDFASTMCEVAVSRLRMNWTIVQDLSRAVPASPGAQLTQLVAGITFGIFPIQLGQIRLQTPIGSEKTYFPIRSLIVIVFEPVGSEKHRR